MMNANQRLKKARKTLRITQKKFAQSIYVSPSFLADIETEYRTANDRVIKLASMVFGISENWLKTGKGEMFYKSSDEKIKRLVGIFNELPADFQDYALQQLDLLLELRKKTIVRGAGKPAPESLIEGREGQKPAPKDRKAP